jgi:hypothetical protein
VTRIAFIAGEAPDAPLRIGAPLGTRGVVLASHDVRGFSPTNKARNGLGTRDVDFFYFVEWADKPGLPIGVADWKIGPA